MAWSVKLQSGAGGVANYNEWEMIFDPSTQTAYKATYNISLGSEAPDVLYHTPDNGSPIPIRATGRNRVIFLEMHIPPQTTWDGVLGKIAPIARLVDGPDSQAMRAQTGGASGVRVAIKPDGASYTTYFDVLHGFVDTSRAFTQDVSILNKTAYKVVAALTCAPFGYGDSFTLANALPSSPHFLEDTDADGLADGWTEIGSPTTAISTTTHLLGKSQSIASTTQLDGIISTDISVGNGVGLVAFVYITVTAGSFFLQLRNVTDGTTLEAKTIAVSDSGAVSDKTAYTNTGTIAYRVVVSGTNSTGGTKNYQLQIRQAADTATASNCLVYMAYLRTGTTTAPPAFSSSSALKNRYDPATTSAATLQQINYLDTWGIPGDVPALVDFFINQTASAADGFMAARIPDGEKRADVWYHWLDSKQLTVLTGGAADVVDATKTQSHFIRWSGTGAASTTYPTGVPYATDGLFWSGFHDWLASVPARVFAIARTSNLGNLLRFTWSGATSGAGAYTLFSATNTWELINLGLMNTTAANEDGAFVIPSLNIVHSAGTLDVDAIIFMPAFEDGLMITPTSTGTAAAPYFYTFGRDEYVTHNKAVGLVLAADIIAMHQGALWNAEAGKGNRFVFFMFGTHSGNKLTYDIATNMTVTTGITPRTSHLLGTV